MTNVALIDADILLFLASYEKTYWHEVTEFLKFKLKEIVENTDSYHYKLFVGGKNNFRYHIRGDYKANRKDKEKPELFNETKKYVIEELNAFVSNGVETDDSIVATAKWCKDTGTYNPIVCTTDKDFNTKANTIYRWERQIMGKVYPSELFIVTEEEALFNQYKQLLVGDNSDNIKTCKGIGDAKASKLLDGKSKYDMVRTIIDTYKKFYGSRWRVKLTEVYHLINLIDDYDRVLVPEEFDFYL